MVVGCCFQGCRTWRLEVLPPDAINLTRSHRFNVVEDIHKEVHTDVTTGRAPGLRNDLRERYDALIQYRARFDNGPLLSNRFTTEVVRL